ncbi:MAG: hypothetical protein CME65_10835 [Halobacteriovoraceae bacterium]|nr:hypothetical protein [Halobacteriovoraceae bacterium]|tara:strand:+ start:23251 stop:23697 length:447 start_codon:yes stop_codon:yes gene_type:complete
MLSLKRGLEYFLAFLFVSLILMVSWQVFSRYVLADPSTVTEELARFLLIWLIFFGATYTFIEKGHLAFELFLEKYESKIPLRSFVSLLVIFLGMILFFGGTNLVYTIFTLGQKTAVLEIPMGLIYLAAPLNGILIIYYAAKDFLEGNA